MTGAPSKPKRLGGLDPVRVRLGQRSEWVLAAHAKFLQRWFRSTKKKQKTGQPSPWSRGGMRAYLPVWRREIVTACSKTTQAGSSDFEAQATRAREVLMWYTQYTKVYKRLTKSAPTVLSTFCGGGGADEGMRRGGVTSSGVDNVDQPEYRARFGDEQFVMGDGCDLDLLRRRVRETGAFAIGAGPPCKPYSTGRKGEPMQPALIAQTRDVLSRIGCMSWIENVVGAASHMDADAVILRGTMFGLHVDRGRKFETSFPVHLDAALTEGAPSWRAGRAWVASGGGFGSTHSARPTCVL